MLTRNANNHFGVKAFGGWTGEIYLAWDDERQKSRFRKYSSAMESFRDHALFLGATVDIEVCLQIAYMIIGHGQ